MEINVWQEYQNCPDEKLKSDIWKNLVFQSITDSKNGFASSIGNDFCNVLASQFLLSVDEECMLTGDEPDHLLDFLSKGYGLHLVVAIERYGIKILTCCNELSSLLFSLLPLILQGQCSDEDNFSFIESLSDKWDVVSINAQFKKLIRDIFSTKLASLKLESKVDNLPTTTLCFDRTVKRNQLFLLLASGFLTLMQNDTMRKNTATNIDFIGKCLSVVLECEAAPLSFILIKLIAVLLYQAGCSRIGVNLILSSDFFSNFSKICSLYLQSGLISGYLVCLNTYIASLACLNQCTSVLFTSPCKHSDVNKLITQFINKDFFHLLKQILLSYDQYSHLDSDKFLKWSRSCIHYIFKQIIKLSKIVEENNSCCIIWKNRKKKISYHSADKKVVKSKNTTKDMMINLSVESHSSDISDIENLLLTSDEFNIDKKLNDAKVTGVSSGDPVCFVSNCGKFLLNWFMEENNVYIIEQLLYSLSNISLCQCIDIDSTLVLILSRSETINESVMDKTLALVSHILSTSPFSQNQSIPQQINGTYDETDNKNKKTFQAFNFINKLNNLIKSSFVITQRVIKHFACLVLNISPFMQEVLLSLIILPNFKLFLPNEYFEHCFTSVAISNESIVEGFLWLILLYMQPDEHSVDLLYSFNYVLALQNLAINSNCHLACKSVEILNQMYKVVSASNLTVLKKSGIEIQKAHINIINTFFIVACELFKKPIEILFTENTVLVYVLAIIDSVYKEHEIVKTEFDKYELINKCYVMYEALMERASGFLKSNLEEHFSDISTALVWLQVLIRLLVASNTNKCLKEDITNHLKNSFISQQVLQSQIRQHVCLSIVNTSIYPQRVFVPEIKERNGSFSFQKSQIELSDVDLQDVCFGFEEQGYEADEESDESEKNQYAKHSVPRHKPMFSKQSISKGISFSPMIDQPWLCIVLLKCLIRFAQENCESVGLLTEVLEELHLQQLYSLQNNKVLYEQGLFGIIINDLSTLLTVNQTDLLKVTGKMISQLSSYSLTAPELKGFLHLFKLANIPKKWLASVLLEMSEIASKRFGPQKYLSFPVQMNIGWINSRRKVALFQCQTDTKSPQQADTKLVHNMESIQYHGVSKKDEEDGRKILNCQNQQRPASEVAPIKLQLKSNFLWPDKELCFSLWFCLKDDLFSKPNESKLRRRFSKLNFSFEQNEYISEELIHLCSFGALNAMFEVWLGTSSGLLQYRWVVSSYGNNEVLSTFDQVIVPHRVLFNVWNYLVVTLLVPSEPHTAKIVTFLDGCQLPSVQMKYPCRSVQSQASLFALIGHGLNEVELKAKVLAGKLLDTGVFMVFQGKHSFMQKHKKDAQTQLNGVVEERVMDKMKAIYMYSLGPNNAHVNIEKNEYFSNQGTSHMDSSLNWDSIVFKELSFCMNVVTENLVANSIPLKLFENPLEILSLFTAELQSSLMLVYNPSSYNEFLQFIPQLKTNGKIQHTYLNENDDQHDGITTNVELLGNIQSNTHYSFLEALNNCGGIAVLIFLHALVAENSHSEEVHLFVLKTIFISQTCCLYLQREMNDMAGYVLINHVLDCTPNKPGLKLLKVLFESICDGQVFYPLYDGEIPECVVNPSTTAVVRNVCILQLLLKNWKFLRRAGSAVHEICLTVLKFLVRFDHPHYNFNVMQFQRARVVENMLMGCRELQQEQATKLEPSLCNLYVDIVHNLLGKPVDLPVLQSLCSFLIATHPTIDTLNLHSPKNFYLIPRVFLSKHSPYSRLLSEKSSRRTSSFNDAEEKLGLSIKDRSTSPQVILSQKDSTPGSIMHSEVIILRNDNSSDSSSPLCNAKPPKQSNTLRMPGHRRIQSDGAVHLKFSADSLKNKVVTITNFTESQEYDIISDSELPSSFEGHEEYLVVDGFIEQKVGSFTPHTNLINSPDADCLFFLRLGLLELLQSTLKLLPDNLLKRVFGNILKFEHLLVLVNQPSDKLREIALENLFIYLERGGRDCFSNFNKFMGFHLLANILHQHEVTVKIIELCLNVLKITPVLLKDNSSKQTIEDAKRIMIAPCMVLLQDSIQKPAGFGLLVKFFIKILDEQERLPLLAFENGFADIIANVVIGLCNENLGPMNSSWKRDCFSQFLLLLDWLVKKACCTCQMVYFQMYKDVQLMLECIDVKRKTTDNNILLYKTCRFLKYYLIQAAFSIFQHPNSYMSSLWCSASSQFPGSPIVSRRSVRGFVAQSIMPKIRGSNYNKVPSPVATQTDIQLTFQEILNDAVKFVTLFNKCERATETVMFGHTLKSLQETKMKTGGDADREFCKSLLLWLFNSVKTAIGAGVHSTIWVSLLKNMKDELIAQGTHIIQHIISPLRCNEIRIYFAELILENFSLLQYMLLSNNIPKTQERFYACLNNLLNTPVSQLSESEVKTLDKLRIMLSHMNLISISDQILVEEIREIKHKKKEEEMEKTKIAFKRIIDRNERLCNSITELGMEVSKVIVDVQDRLRQKLLRVIRGSDSKNMEVRKAWKNVIQHLTQERAPWYDEKCYPCSWQLDPTEGPSRMRKRLQRCHLDIPERFFLPNAKARKQLHLKPLLSYLFDESGKPAAYSFKTNDIIRFPYHCQRVTPAAKSAGEFLIGETHMYFVVEDTLKDENKAQTFFSEKDIISISWRYEEIREILRRRYSLQDNALEIFLTSGRTFLLAFKDTKVRDEVFDHLMSRELPNLVATATDLNTLTNCWREGLLTNFEYLMELNKKAGRSFNDLMQYPVYPFVLADYDSELLDLRSPQSYRNLSKPIACQDKNKEEKYIENYNYLKSEYEQRKLFDPIQATPPYHYSSHYSNSGTVLHFLVRLPPFTNMFLIYQDNQFDIPDRTFHSISTTWKLSSFISSTDVKELIPEFFFLQEFLLNNEDFNMGIRQNGEPVHNIDIPKWAHNNPRLFTLIHMQALESAYVSENLHNWIDLVFGYKQSGSAAVKATNLFHPATYFGVDVNAVKDTIHRRALQTMIETYGQTPLQLFSAAHTKKVTKHTLVETLISNTVEVMLSETPKDCIDGANEVQCAPFKSVVGIDWGNYCGSPFHEQPVAQHWQSSSVTIHQITTSSDSLSAYLCGANACVLSNNSLDTVTYDVGMLTWGWADSMLRVQRINGDVKKIFAPMRPDRVTCCAYVPGAEILFVGGESGVLNVWPIKYSNKEPILDIIGAKQNLLGHDDAITSISINQSFSIVVTSSKDKTAIIWDLNRLCYIRSLPPHESSVDCVAINDASGDIATSCAVGKHSRVYVWTVNAKVVGNFFTSDQVRCLGFSCLSDGKAVNVVIAGMSNGEIRFWETWTLQPLRRLLACSSRQPITAVSFSNYDSSYLISADRTGKIAVWSPNDINLIKTPLFVIVGNK